MVRSNEQAPLVHDWWSHFLNPVRHFGERVAQFLSPTADAAATGEAYEIAVELPGIPEDQIQPEIQGTGWLVPEKTAGHEESGRNRYFSERVHDRCRRSFQLPADAELAKVSAIHKDGVLIVTAAKHTLVEQQNHRSCGLCFQACEFTPRLLLHLVALACSTMKSGAMKLLSGPDMEPWWATTDTHRRDQHTSLVGF